MLNRDMVKRKEVKAFLKGAARIVDIFGDLDRRPLFERNDAKAMRDDWGEVSAGIHDAVDEYGSRKKHQPA
jgi:hypothetical protein